MTPIVFCASLVPCASETSDAEPIWPQRNACRCCFSGDAAGDAVDQPGADRGDQRWRRAAPAARG